MIDKNHKICDTLISLIGVFFKIKGLLLNIVLTAPFEADFGLISIKPHDLFNDFTCPVVSLLYYRGLKILKFRDESIFGDRPKKGEKMKKLTGALVVFAGLLALPQTALADIRYRLFLEEGVRIEFENDGQVYKQGTALGIQLKEDGQFNWQAALAWPAYAPGLSPRASVGAHWKPIFKNLPNFGADSSGVYQYDFTNDRHFVGGLLAPTYTLSDAFDVSLVLLGGRYLLEGSKIASATLNLTLTLPF